LSDKGVVIFANSITCAPAQFDAVYDAGVKDWLASGAQAIIDERRAKIPN
jgi:putative aldouronate transport system substrate-binding protein